MRNEGKNMKHLHTIIIALIFFASGLLLGRSVVAPAPVFDASSVIQTEGEKISVVHFLIDFGNDELQTFPHTAFEENETLWKVLQRTLQEENISVDYREYEGMGVFIESIGGVANSGTTYWQYWVNGIYAEIGASAYLVQPGDTILWKFTKNQF